MTEGTKSLFDTTDVRKDESGAFGTDVGGELVEELLHQRRGAPADAEEVKVRHHNHDAGAPEEQVDEEVREEQDLHHRHHCYHVLE